jgi:hypothetical protein
MEIYEKFVNVVEDMRWGNSIASAVRSFEDPLNSTWAIGSSAVASALKSPSGDCSYHI